jgi:phosphoglucomutase
MKDKAFELAKSWANNTYFDQEDRKLIQDMLQNPEANEKEIIESFYQDLEFGTGGLRSIIGMGSNRMNKYNVRRATQAMANIVLSEKPSNPCVTVSFDCRKYSDKFAQEVCGVFAANGIKAYIFKELTPTPMLSYALRYYKAHAGVMITASHNPKQYNGYKAYWSDGAQVTPPQDKNIIEAYNQLTDWNDIKFKNFDEAMSEGMVEYISDECSEEFYQLLEGLSLNPKMCQEEGRKLHVIFTPLHGTGYKPCMNIAKRMGFSKFEEVQEQSVFDSSFSTVATTPNPEDPKALEQAVLLMKAKDADLVYGTDPDCDRLGVVVNHKHEPHYLNGNQIAFIMLYYIFGQLKEQNKLPSNPLVIKSIVTSDLQRNIVESFGGTVLNTLTGFKWMARLWKDLLDQGTNYNFVFASEESFGYMTHEKARDKDAVGAISMMNEAALYYKLQGKTLIDVLDEIYEKYGFALESLIAKTYEGIEGKEKISRIMEYFRNNPTIQFGDEEVAIFEDYQSLKRKNVLENTETDFEFNKSNILCFTFKSGHKIFLRPSGTEPKIKFYTMVNIQDGTLEERKQKAQERIKVIEDFVHKTIADI